MRGFSGILGGFLPGIWPEIVGNWLFRLGESSWISFGPSCWFSGRFWRFLCFFIFLFLGILGILISFFEKWIFGDRYGFQEAFQEIQNEISLPGTSWRPQNHYSSPFTWREGWNDDDTTTTTLKHLNPLSPPPLRTQGWNTSWGDPLTSTYLPTKFPFFGLHWEFQDPDALMWFIKLTFVQKHA